MKNNKCLNAKLFCKRIEKLNVLIENKQYELQEVRAKAGYIPSNGFHERIQTTRTNDKMETGNKPTRNRKAVTGRNKGFDYRKAKQDKFIRKNEYEQLSGII